MYITCLLHAFHAAAEKKSIKTNLNNFTLCDREFRNLHSPSSQDGELVLDGWLSFHYTVEYSHCVDLSLILNSRAQYGVLGIEYNAVCFRLSYIVSTRASSRWLFLYFCGVLCSFHFNRGCPWIAYKLRSFNIVTDKGNLKTK